MKNELKVLFVGLGSIGTRHLNNLAGIAKEQNITLTIDALRSGTRELPQATASLISHQYATQAELTHYDLAFVTNPTSCHYDTLCSLRGKAESIFIEKPIFDTCEREILDCLDAEQKAYVAAPMRFCGTFLALEQLMPSLAPYSVRVICSSYLPEWRKGVDYRTVYSARKSQGGGVTIDLIHEWDYMLRLFGMPLEMYNFKGTYSELEIDSDDLSVYIARYQSLLAEVHLDYFGREYRRSIELFCKDGTVTADFGKGTITLANGEVREYKEDVNERYLREMRAFLAYATKGGECYNTPREAQNTLALTLGENK